MEILDRRYIEAILNAPARINVVYRSIAEEEMALRRKHEDQFTLAEQLAKVMKLPEDHPDRRATVTYLETLLGGGDVE